MARTKRTAQGPIAKGDGTIEVAASDVFDHPPRPPITPSDTILGESGKDESDSSEDWFQIESDGVSPQAAADAEGESAEAEREEEVGEEKGEIGFTSDKYDPYATHVSDKDYIFTRDNLEAYKLTHRMGESYRISMPSVGYGTIVWEDTQSNADHYFGCYD